MKKCEYHPHVVVPARENFINVGYAHGIGKQGSKPVDGRLVTDSPD